MKKKRPTIKFSIHPSRYGRKELKRTPKPIKRSRYAQELWDVITGDKKL